MNLLLTVAGIFLAFVVIVWGIGGLIAGAAVATTQLLKEKKTPVAPVVQDCTICGEPLNGGMFTGVCSNCSQDWRG